MSNQHVIVTRDDVQVQSIGVLSNKQVSKVLQIISELFLLYDIESNSQDLVLYDGLFKMVALYLKNNPKADANDIFDYKPYKIQKKMAAIRDGKCLFCETTQNLTIHHQKFQSDGGCHSLANLKILCVDCHCNFHTYFPHSSGNNIMLYRDSILLTRKDSIIANLD
ncbi:MAG: HNH endonuclease [candidate division SR1 bacterium]|nr:HNH endonuclease [candidate division SR1 bacterium]